MTTVAPQKSWTEEVSSVASENDGFVPTDELVRRGVAASWLSLLGRQGRLDRIAHGLYRVPGWPSSRLTQYREAMLWAKGRAVIAGEAALDVWELCEVNPRKIDLIVDHGYRPRKAGGNIYRVSRRIVEADSIDSCDGVRVLSPYEAIIDASKKGVASKLILRAIDVAQARELVTKRQAARLLVGMDTRDGK